MRELSRKSRGRRARDPPMRAFAVTLLLASASAFSMQLGGKSSAAGKRLLVIGGNGFVGRQVVKYAVQSGYEVTSLSRRGENPKPNDDVYAQVEWCAGNALDKATVTKYVDKADAVVHCIGLLFDIGLSLTHDLDFFPDLLDLSFMLCYFSLDDLHLVPDFFLLAVQGGDLGFDLGEALCFGH